ncbi:hypothetical protein OGAPHI_006205 [Ogataea philodendri]|uniref:Uncharacterized protein n=1 Tax=Ogataea philodendri TaxID=1378263 RepID=A0A9P8NZR4_9ASCO|nr:uncharacterized protein OGAPHI_006205 [Ogataea philodendri]KAH3662024.1 hypothetical protein OGAPHI_006205 [Ogataea philodendri]
MKRGLCTCDMLINICLCLLGYVPGLVHSWYIILKSPDRVRMEDLERHQIIINSPPATASMVISRQPDQTRIRFSHPEPFKTQARHSQDIFEQGALSPLSSTPFLNRPPAQPSQLNNVTYGSIEDDQSDEAPPSYDNVMNETSKQFQ